MRLPYIRINQKEEFFIFTKMKVADLRNKVNFRFRNPYSNQSQKDFRSVEDYIKRFRNKNINVEGDENGIQRRMNLDKINDITSTMNKIGEIMPNAVLLCFDFTDVDQEIEYLNKFDSIFSNDFGEFELDDNLKFRAIDGQHRLAGLFMCDEKIQQQLEVPVLLLLDAGNELVAKIFADINGKQTKVNNSVVLDLLEYKESSTEVNAKLHNLCKKLNNDINSPFYHHIKMLGYGFGAISQSFMVIYLSQLLKDIGKNYDNYFYLNIYYYFCAIQTVFSSYWPVPIYKSDIKDFDAYVVEYSYEKTHNEFKTSNHNQIMKTNGIGAFLKLAPSIFKEADYYNENGQVIFDKYCELLKKANSFDWINDETVSGGTSQKTQKAIAQKLRKLIFNS